MISGHDERTRRWRMRSVLYRVRFVILPFFFFFFWVVVVVFCVPPHRLSFLVCRAQNGDDETVERERLATNEDQDDADKEFRLLCIRPHP